MTIVFNDCRHPGTALLLLGLIFSVTYIGRQYRSGHVTEEETLPVTFARREVLYPKRQLKETSDVASKIYPEQLDSPPVDMSSKGFVILESVSKRKHAETVLDLLVLQCWATKHKLSLVEPLVGDDDRLGTPLLLGKEGTRVKNNFSPLEKFYNMKKWSDAFQHSAFLMNKMVAFKEVDLYHSRAVIVINIQDQSYGELDPINPPNCMNNSNEFQKKMSENGIDITQELCFNKNSPLQEMLAKLSEVVAKEQDKIVLIIRKWPDRKVEELTSLSSFLQCGIAQYKHLIKETIQEQASHYVNKHFRNNTFTAIVLTEDTLNSRSFSGCLERTLTRLYGLKVNDSKMKVFVAVQESRDSSMTRLIPFKMFFRALYHASYTIEGWKEDIDHYNGGDVKDMKHRIQLQQAIAGKANCLIISGEGVFSNTIKRYFKRKNSDSYRCVFTVPECINSF